MTEIKVFFLHTKYLYFSQYNSGDPDMRQPFSPEAEYESNANSVLSSDELDEYVFHVIL